MEYIYLLSLQIFFSSSKRNERARNIIKIRSSLLLCEISITACVYTIVKIPNTRFHENPSSGSPNSSKRTDRHDKASSRALKLFCKKSLKYVKRDSKKLTHGIMCECRWEQPAQSKQKGRLQRRITEHAPNTNIGDKSQIRNRTSFG
jgi:hypothetical protein